MGVGKRGDTEMTPAHVLIALWARGCLMTADGDDVLVRPRSRITLDLDDAIRQYKPVLLAIAQAWTPGQRLPGKLPLIGDDYHEAEALILAALGCWQSAQGAARSIADPERELTARACIEAMARTARATDPAELGGVA